MRISTGQMSNSALNAMLQRQVELSKTQLQVATGKKAITPSDDPVAAAATLNLEQTKTATERYQRNADAATARLSIEDTALGSVSDHIQRLRELTIQGGSGTLNDDDRKFIAAEMHKLLDGLVQVGNTKDNNGDYLFSGGLGNTTPYVRDSAGNYLYQGDDGQRLLQVGPSQRIADADPGSAVFSDIRNGNGVTTVQDNPANTGGAHVINSSVTDKTAYTDHSYQIDFVDNAGTMQYTVTDMTNTPNTVVVPATNYSDGGAISFDGLSISIEGQPADGDSFSVQPSERQSLFETVQNVINAMEADTSLPGGKARLTNAVRRGLGDLDRAHNNVLGIRAQVGARMNTIDHNTGANDNMMLQIDKTLSKLNDVDLASAVADMNLQMTSLQAAQQSYSKIQGLSLFNFI